MKNSQIALATLCLGFLLTLGMLGYGEVKQLNQQCVQLSGGLTQ